MKILQYCIVCGSRQVHEITNYPLAGKPGWSEEVQKCLKCSTIRKFSRNMWRSMPIYRTRESDKSV